MYKHIITYIGKEVRVEVIESPEETKEMLQQMPLPLMNLTSPQIGMKSLPHSMQWI
jgi:hypothetical protein